LSCLFDKTKRQLIDIFSLCRKDNLKKDIFFVIFLDIFSLYRKDNLKKITFSYLLAFCAVWEVAYIIPSKLHGHAPQDSRRCNVTYLKQ